MLVTKAGTQNWVQELEGRSTVQRAWATKLAIIFILSVVTVPVLAVTCPFSGTHATLLVKTGCEGTIILVDPFTGQIADFDIVSIDWTVTSFYGLSVSIWQGSGDPNMHTANPIIRMYKDVDGNGTQDSPFAFITKSLLDLGTYYFTLSGIQGQWQDTGYTDAYGNHVLVYATSPMQANLLDFTVKNDAPTANIKINGDLHVGHTLALAANSNDPDGGNLPFHEWSVMSKPANSADSIATPNQASATLSLNDKHSIGSWSIKLRMADDEGQLAEFSKNFTIDNQKPTLAITGPSSINALDHIHLAASPAQDADGENITWVWDILQAPKNATRQPQNGFGSNQIIDFVTGPTDIGIWKFKCTATDEHAAAVDQTVTVEVKAILPKITISSTQILIKYGASIHFETTTLKDAYGAPLQFSWDVIQVPQSAGVGLAQGYSASAAIDIPMAAAGTWKLILTVTDQIGRTATQKVSALVDGSPTAAVVGPNISGNLTQVLTLDGSSSVDPDSPNTPP